MKLQTTKYGKKAQRVNFGKIKSKINVPNLLDIQIKSFEWLMQEGINDIFEATFPIIKQAAETTKLEYLGCEFREEKHTLAEVRQKSLTYSKPLFAKIRLQNGKTGEIKDADVFFGDFPVMTDKGTFLINGSERVIVSQLVRSSGVHYYTKRKPTTIEEEYIVIATRGSWIEYVITNKAPVVYKENRAQVVMTRQQKETEKYYVKLDRTKRLAVPTLLLGLGISVEDQINLFGHSKIFRDTLTAVPKVQKANKDFVEAKTNALYDIYSKIKPGEPATIKGVVNLLKSKFFDDSRYDLASAGRYKFNSKLAVWKRLANTILAEDIKDEKGKVLVKKGTLLEGKSFQKAKEALSEGANTVIYQPNEQLNTTDGEVISAKSMKLNHEEIKLQIVSVLPNEDAKESVKVIGNWQDETKKHITISDIIASFSYLVNLKEDELAKFDDVDNLANRRIKHVGELVQNQFRIGLTRIQKNVLEKITSVDAEKMTPKNLINIKPLTSSIREFFLSSQLSQFMDQTNPQSELSNKRRISALGPGGLSRNFAGTDVRDVNSSHYGRICPIETPEGPNVGLINNLALYASVNQHGFIETPYAKVKKQGKKFVITKEIVYLSAEEETDYIIGGVNIKTNDKNEIIDKEVVARFNGENIMAKVEDVKFVDVSAQQILSIASSCIPFLEHDDATRAAMGANMQRQAVPLLKPSSPIVGTGLEHIAAKYSGAALTAKESGKVKYVDSTKIVIKTAKEDTEYILENFAISNQGTIIHHKPIVSNGEKVAAGQIIADGPSMQNGELALGANVKVAFTTWNGYNYEDAIIISERLVKDDVYTSIHISEYILECRTTPQGEEEITSELPNVAAKAKKFLDERGIITVGSSVKQGDILVGKVSPKAQVNTSPEEKLIRAIFGDKSKNIKETSLRVPHGAEGVVQSVKVFTNNDIKLPPGVNQIVKVYIAQKRKIQEGDKMAGRHGNKGVISIVLPEEDMPIMQNGEPIDILLNPLGVPSRMNIGQVLEIHLGIAAEKLGVKVATPGFDGCSLDELASMMKKAGIAEHGKFELRDGRTGEKFDKLISVGIMYMLKLSHMVDDKMHSRSTGPYSIITQQPLGGKAQKGGQRFGEMEVWALEAYGAAYTLQELLTVKSDDISGRSETYNSILYNRELPEAGVPESFGVLQKELQALSLNLEVKTKEKPEQ